MAPRRSLPYQAYLAYMRGRGSAAAERTTPRPQGTLIWLHLSTPHQARALTAIGERIAHFCSDAALLMTGRPDTPPPCAALDDLPQESLPAIEAFLGHWQPDICLWEGPVLRPALLTETHRSGVPACLVNASPDALSTAAPRWLPDLSAHALQAFDRVFAPTRSAQARFMQDGLAPERIRHSGPLAESVTPLSCNIDEQEEMAAALGGRPVWLAAAVRPEEVRGVLVAHRRAGRLAHRLLLVLVPHDEAHVQACAAQVQEAGLRLCDWSAGDMPDENTQVLLADDPETLGLWYRLAPVALIGGTLEGNEESGQSPLNAAALGSAILHGPGIGADRAVYARLAERHAVRLVRDVDELAGTVIQLTAPDKAAAMAHAAWECVTEGAELADAVADWALDALDQRRAG